MKLPHFDNIDISETKKYALSVYCHPTSYSFMLKDAATQEQDFFSCALQKSKNDPLEDFKSVYYDNDFFSYRFGKIALLCYSDKFTFVPSDCYTAENKDDYVKFMFFDKRKHFLSNKVVSINSETIFSVEEKVYDFFCRSFVNVKFIHYTTSLINYFQNESTNLRTKLMAVNLHRNSGMDILCFDRGKMLLCNYFPAETLSGALYYILYVWKHLKFGSLTDLLMVSGEISTRFKLMETLELYIQNIATIEESSVPLEQKLLKI